MRFTTLLLTLLALASFGQDNPKSDNQIMAGLAIGSGQAAISGALVHNWLLGKNRKFEVGVGVRLTGYLGRNQYYVTAPAELTSGSTGPGVLFKENIKANMDTFLIAKPGMLATNIMINLGYRFTSKISAGFNIDAVGFTIGTEKTGNYINGSSGSFTSAKPTGFNALLISDNDLGTLNSELYGQYKLNDKWALRAGAQFLFTEYTTETEIQTFPEPNDRFRLKSLMFMVGTSIKLN